MNGRIGVAVMVLGLVLAGVTTVSPLGAAPGETISFAMLAGYKEDVLRANIGSFEQQTGIKVAIDASPYNDLYQKTLLSLSTSARRYDVMFMDEPWVPGLSSFLLPLGDVIKGIDLADFVPTTLASGRYKGKQYAMPVDPNVQVFIYRKDLFQQHNLGVPDTWDDVLRDAQTLNDPAKEMAGVVTTAGSDQQTGLYMLLLIWSYGGDVLGPDGRSVADSPAARKGASVYVQLLKYAPLGVQSYSFADVNKAVQLGKAAMAIQWASGARPMEDKAHSLVAGKLGYAVMPRGDQRTPMRGVWTIGIAQTTQHQEAAAKFVQWITGREFGRAAALYPATSSAIHSPRFSVLRDPKIAEALPYAPALLDNLKIARERARVPQWPDIQEQLRLYGAKVSTGAPLGETLAQLTASINDVMNK